ncbi:hypothetical protein ACKGJY_06015 [Hyunsoonleella sp. 2307UL5-6]|uniref:hypothetical protein n=1 Tax=Hyunsoonleella sp. 2307UL5-6 TaxID=3384768 RepID=UPI0039BD2416
MKPTMKLHPFCMIFGHNFIRVNDNNTFKTSKVICKNCKLPFKYNTLGEIVQDCSKDNKQFLKKFKDIS